MDMPLDLSVKSTNKRLAANNNCTNINKLKTSLNNNTATCIINTINHNNNLKPTTKLNNSIPKYFSGRIEKVRKRTMLPCEHCGKEFDRPSLLMRHLRTHTGEKPYICDICAKGFSTSSSLNTHRRIHTGDKPHVCEICNKRFTASSNLYYHRMTHKKEKPHKCGLCSKSFPTPGDLKSHMYVHNGSWPFKCHICDRGFSKPTNLKNHMSIHKKCESYSKRLINVTSPSLTFPCLHTDLASQEHPCLP